MNGSDPIPPRLPARSSSGPAGGHSSGRPPWGLLQGLPWGTIAAAGAAGALLLVAFVAQSGSSVALVGSSLIAVVLAVVAVVAGLRSRGRQSYRAPATWPAPGEVRAKDNSGGPYNPLAKPDAVFRPSVSVKRDDEAATPAQPAPARFDGGGGEVAERTTTNLPQGVALLARDLAQTVAQHLFAPAAAVLVPRGRRLVAAGTAGDWALARRMHAAARDGVGGLLLGMSPGANAEDPDPPEFALDESLPRLLARQRLALPVERWQELTDVPGGLLPLVALADRGTAIAVPLAYQDQFTGLCVLARRAQGEAYSDSELRLIERLAHEAEPALFAALQRDASWRP